MITSKGNHTIVFQAFTRERLKSTTLHSQNLAQEKVSKFLLTLYYHFEYSLTEFFLATTTKASFTEPPASIPSQININKEDSSEDEM